jgi:hypothetical protein
LRSDHRRRHQGEPIAADEEKGSDRPTNHERLPDGRPEQGLPRCRGCRPGGVRSILCHHNLLAQ